MIVWTIVTFYGMRERWPQRRLAAWEVPRHDPAGRRPWHPQVAEQRRESRGGSLELRRAREAAQDAVTRWGTLH
jgi:hypothetical protein